MRRLAVLAAAAALLGGCGYSLVGTGKGTLPEAVRTVWVPAFVNDTPVVGMEQRLTTAVLRELSARGRLRPAPSLEQADAVLSGRITAYSLQPVRFDAQGRALEYQVMITARLTLTDRKTEKTLFDDPAFLFRQPYNVPVTDSSYFNPELLAIDRMSQPFARSVVATILEGF
ncbi:MAG TPA: LptE family protein [Thermoanaerobaculia bacterium]|nr:LptE family protein [Thermoanaerobaculia bacterium]HQR67880.1 LptE family protein [Thermoanaerobaculia bacterium]